MTEPSKAKMFLVDEKSLTEFVDGALMCQALVRVHCMLTTEGVLKWSHQDIALESFTWKRQTTEERVTWIPAVDYPISAGAREMLMSGPAASMVLIPRMLNEIHNLREAALLEATDRLMRIGGPMLGTVELTR